MIFNTTKRISNKDISSKELSSYNDLKKKFEELSLQITNLTSNLGLTNNNLTKEAKTRLEEDTKLLNKILALDWTTDVNAVDTKLTNWVTTFSATVAAINTKLDSEVATLTETCDGLREDVDAIDEYTEANKVRTELTVYKASMQSLVNTLALEASNYVQTTQLAFRNSVQLTEVGNYTVMKMARNVDYIVRSENSFINLDATPDILQWHNTNYAVFYGYDNDYWYVLLKDYTAASFLYGMTSCSTLTPSFSPIETYSITDPSELSDKHITAITDKAGAFIFGQNGSGGGSYIINFKHKLTGYIDDCLQYPIMQYSPDDSVTAFYGKFYAVQMLSSEQIPTSAVLAYVDESGETVKFCSTYAPYIGTVYGTVAQVTANKEWFDSITWLNRTSVTTDISGFSNTENGWTVNADNSIAERNITIPSSTTKVTVVRQASGNDDTINVSANSVGRIVLTGSYDESTGKYIPDPIMHGLAYLLVTVTEGNVNVKWFNATVINGVVTAGYASNTNHNTLTVTAISGELPIESFSYTVSAIEVTNVETSEVNWSYSGTAHEFLEYKHNTMDTLVDERSNKNTYNVDEIITLLSEDIDFSTIVII